MTAIFSSRDWPADCRAVPAPALFEHYLNEPARREFAAGETVQIQECFVYR